MRINILLLFFLLLYPLDGINASDDGSSLLLKSDSELSFEDEDEEVIDFEDYDESSFDDEDEEVIIDMSSDGLSAEDKDSFAKDDTDNQGKDDGPQDAKEIIANLTYTDIFNFLSETTRFTFQHDLGYRIKNPERIVVNRSALRMRWEYLLSPHFFLLFDGKMSYDAAYDYLDVPLSTKRRYRSQKKVRETYLQGSFGAFSFKFGKQIVGWGTADGAVVTDVLSPRDMTDFLFTSIEDARIGQVMFTVDHYSSTGQWTFVFNPDPQANRFAKGGHEFALPSIGDLEGIGLESERKPEGSLFNMEFGARWKKAFEGSDLAFMIADLFEDTPVYKSLGSGDGFQLLLRPEYRRYQMLGTAMNYSAGNFLWKGELALKHNRTFKTTDPLKDNGLSQKDTIDSALGMEYSANGNYLLSFEISDQHILDWSEELLPVREDEGSLYIVCSKQFLHDTLTPQYTIAYQIQDQETLHTLKFTYDISDQWDSMFAIAHFDAYKKDSLLGYFRDHDLMLAQIKYHF